MVTGYTGSAAARELRKQGHRVRGLVHKIDARSKALRASGVEPVVGDLLDLDSIRRAMEGVAGAYFVYPISAEGLIDAAAFTAQAAIEAGVQSLVDMSQRPARREAKSHASRDHWVSERVFDWSDIPTTRLRPTFFTEWLIYQRPGWEVKNGIIRFPFGRSRHAPIAAKDQGRVIAAVLTNPVPHAGKVYPLFGPVELDHYQIAEKLSTTLGRPFRYEPVSIPEFVTIMRQGGMSARAIQHIASVAQDYQDGIFSRTNDVIERITGKPPLTLEEWVERNRANFDQPVLDSTMISSTGVAVT
jgi:NAD(P)H dehydrogenase (quinone)